MEQFDSQLTQSIWQRVQGRRSEFITPDILSFLQEEYADLSRYQHLQSIFTASQKAQLHQLIQKTKQCIAILSGIAYLQSDTLPEQSAYPLPKELPSSSLRRLYGDTLRRSNRYAQWRSDSTFGIAFTQLEIECHHRCILLLQFIGHINLK